MFPILQSSIQTLLLKDMVIKSHVKLFALEDIFIIYLKGGTGRGLCRFIYAHIR